MSYVARRRCLRSHPMAVPSIPHRRPWRPSRTLIALSLGVVLPMLILQSASARYDDLSGRVDPFYVVQPADTVSAIAFAYGVSVNKLVELNELADADVIRVGQRLRLGEVTPSAVVASYVVQPGDTLSGIARSGGMSVQELVDWNDLSDPNVIAAGQELQIKSVGSRSRGAARRHTYVAGAASAVIKKPSKHIWEGRPYGDPIAIVLHTTAGSLEGMDAWFQQERSHHSAHFGIGLDGRIHQYVNLGDRAWANGTLEPDNSWPGPAWINPNHITISIETEDLGNPNQPVTEAQYQATLASARIALKQYPKVRYLVTHRAISPETRPSDPGARWIRSGRFAALATELGLEPVP